MTNDLRINNLARYYNLPVDQPTHSYCRTHYLLLSTENTNTQRTRKLKNRDSHLTQFVSFIYFRMSCATYSMAMGGVWSGTSRDHLIRETIKQDFFCEHTTL